MIDDLDLSKIDPDQFVAIAYQRRGGLQMMADRIRAAEAERAELARQLEQAIKANEKLAAELLALKVKAQS
jgi:hypothetical protein